MNSRSGSVRCSWQAAGCAGKNAAEPNRPLLFEEAKS
jgi:hypothetical protein